MTAACPVCGFAGGTVVARRFHSSVVRCGACRVAYQHPPTPEDDVRRYYEHLYVDPSSSGRIDERRRRLFLAFLDRVADAGGRRLLDVGCGTGEFMVLARSRGWQPSGVDVSPEAVETAQRLGLDVHRGPGGSRLPFDDGAFDVVTCWNVIEFFRHPVAELSELARVLAPGGRLFIRTQNETFHLAAYRVSRAVRWPPALAGILQRAWVVHPLLWGPRTLRATLRRIGFDDVRVWNSPTSWGDPYAVLGGRDRALGAVKTLVYGVAQLLYACSATRLVVGSSIAVLARRRP